MGTIDNATVYGIRAAERATWRSTLLYACVLEGYAWGCLPPAGIGFPAPPADVLDELERELDRRASRRRELRRGVRAARAAAARLDLPEQIW
jgi:hypothetical protein